MDKDKFKSKFIDIENIANVQIMKCYRLLFSDKIKDNYGSFIILSLLFIGIISIFLFYFHGYNILKKTMKNIFDAINSGIKEKGIETQNINVTACKFYKKQGAVLSKVDMYAYYSQPDSRDEIQFIMYLDL